MKLRNIIIAIALIMQADASYALPPIVMYTYTPPVPVLQLISANPHDLQELDVSPPAVTLTFSQGLEPNASSFTVFDPYNNPIAAGASSARDSVLQGNLPPHLLAGVYRVDWKAMCSCTGNANATGTLRFTID